MKFLSAVLPGYKDALKECRLIIGYTLIDWTITIFPFPESRMYAKAIRPFLKERIINATDGD